MDTSQKLLELQQAVRALLDKRSETEMTYEDAYYFTFKRSARNEWDKLMELIDYK